MSGLAAKRSPETFLCVAGEMFLPLAEGALWWTAQKTLIVSDLHLEKGSSYARRGQLLPPYDTSATLGLVETLASRFSPDRIISLGDSFHDRTSEARLDPCDRDRIKALTSSTDWVWVEGNHDPDPPAYLGGRGVKVLRIGACVFRHEPTGEAGELSGHLHPVARIAGRGRSVRRKCFITNGTSLVMPSMGTFTGGLNVIDPAIQRYFGCDAMIFASSGAGIHLVDRRALVPDRPTRERNAHWRL